MLTKSSLCGKWTYLYSTTAYLVCDPVRCIPKQMDIKFELCSCYTGLEPADQTGGEKHLSTGLVLVFMLTLMLIVCTHGLLC